MLFGVRDAEQPGGAVAWFFSLAQADQFPSAVFCRACHTVAPIPPGSLTAKTSISPLWPSEAVNEVMGDMPFRPFGAGCTVLMWVWGAGARYAQAQAVTAGPGGVRDASHARWV